MIRNYFAYQTLKYNLLTNSMEQSSSSEAACHSADQEIFRFL
jgi:hypothetical protein